MDEAIELLIQLGYKDKLYMIDLEDQLAHMF